jgi:hypothetical protein
MVDFIQLVAYYVTFLRDCADGPCCAWFKHKVPGSAIWFQYPVPKPVIQSLAKKYVASKMSQIFKELSKSKQDNLVEPIVSDWFQKHPDGSVGSYVAYSPATACILSTILSIDVGTTNGSEIENALDGCETPPAKKARVCQYVNKKAAQTSSDSESEADSDAACLQCPGCGYSGLAQHMYCPAEDYIFISDAEEIHNAIVKVAISSKKKVKTDRQEIMDYNLKSEFNAKPEVVQAPYICSVFMIDIEQFLSNLQSQGYTAQELFGEDSNVYKISR